MRRIHPTALVDPAAELAEDVEIGPYAIIGPGVRLGQGCWVGAHALLEGWTEVGSRTRIWPGALIGGEPQDLRYRGARSYVRIGEECRIREGVTIHRSSRPEGTTRVGRGVFLMAFSHVAHDCEVGDGATLTNLISLSGHVQVGRGVFLSNFVGVHQFVRIGEGAMVLGPHGIRKDVLPFVILDGFPPRVRGLNVEGLRRRGASAEVRAHLKAAYRIIFRSGLGAAEACRRICDELPQGEEVRAVVEFLESSERGIYREEGE
ncbi:MAG: acyl-ACP--UDP-N-acetylglucosamine O-acyltransferase [Nitrospinota bacterium]